MIAAKRRRKLHDRGVKGGREARFAVYARASVHSCAAHSVGSGMPTLRFGGAGIRGWRRWTLYPPVNDGVSPEEVINVR